MIDSTQLPPIETIAVVGAGMLNLCGFVWAAARITGKLETLIKSFDKFTDRVDKIETTQNGHTTELALLWDGRERRRGVDDRRDDPK